MNLLRELPAQRLCHVTHIRICLLNITIIFILLLVRISDETMPGVLHDYCEIDYFEAECPPGTTVVIEEARYGRMELGTCLSASFGYLDCYSNVLTWLDQRCSGRSACRILVSLMVEFRKSCIVELASYLQARYTCESVMVPDAPCCHTPGDRIIAAANAGLISNYMTQLSGCGGIDCPWFLEASPGQMFNISLLDFSTYQRTSATSTTEDGRRESNDRRCNVYANIIEEANGARMTVCSGVTRHRHLYTTITNSVEIQVVNTGQNKEAPTYFALAFQAFGCADLNPPQGGVIDRQGDRAIVTCVSTNAQWEILCKDGEWQGNVETCSRSYPDFDEEDRNSHFTREVYLVLVIAIAFVLAVAIVTTGVVCLYRHWTAIHSNEMDCADQSPYQHPPNRTYLASEFNHTIPRQDKPYADVGYRTHIRDGKRQPTDRFMTNSRTDTNKDKGYYSDHTYESPMHGHVLPTGPGALGYNMVNPREIQTEFK